MLKQENMADQYDKRDESMRIQVSPVTMHNCFTWSNDISNSLLKKRNS